MRRNVAEQGPHPVDRHVGRKVCEKRLSLGYNQTVLGRALGLTFQQVQKYERGINRISSSKLWEIARFFDVDVNYFFMGLEQGEAASPRPLDQQPAPKLVVNRYAVEIGHLAPRLSARQQKLALAIIQSMKGMPPTDGD